MRAQDRIDDAGLQAAVPPEGPFSRVSLLLDLMLELVLRELRLRYKRSLLGIAWSLVTPLSQLLVLHFVFTVILPLEIPQYASFLFVGILVWNWLAGSLDQATGSIVDNRELVRQPGFPVPILPVVTVAVNLVHFLLALPILAVFLWLGGAPSLFAPVAILPALVALQFVLILSIAYFVATFHVTFRDTKHLLGMLLTLGFYITPVFYELRHVPEQYLALYALNPMVHVIGAYRNILLHGAWPSPHGLMEVALASVVLLLLGYLLFTRTSYRFVDEL